MVTTCVRRAKLVLLTLVAAAAISQTSGTVGAQSSNPLALPRLAFNDIQYLGGFRLPATSSNGDSFSIGGKQVAFNPAGNSLFVGSRAGRVAEVSIPAPVNSSDVNALPFASYIQPFNDPMEGHLVTISSDGASLDGLMVYNNRLYGTASIYYDANNTQRVSHFSRSLQLSQSSFSGWSQVWLTGRTGFVSGAMAVIPSDWRGLLGGPAATGQCCIPVVGRTSWGPSAFSFDPAQVGAPAVPASPLLYYTGDHPTLGNWDGSNPTYGATISMGGMAIISGTRTALYFGRNGLGPNCYGNGTSDRALHGTRGPDGALWCYDPTSDAKGSHAYPYRYQIWAYDLADFAAVKAGTKQPWEVVPYGVWPFDLPTQESQVKLGGVGYDAARQVLYISQMFADRDGYSYRPVIHVLQLGTPSDRTAPAAPGLSQPAPAPVADGGNVVRSVNLAVDRNAPQATLTPITFTANAVGGRSPYEYKWLVSDGTSWRPLTGWSAQNAFVWTPGTANAAYRIGVWARSAGNTNDAAEAEASTPFAITAPQPVQVRSITITADKRAPQLAGTPVTWTATVVGGSMLQFKWFVHDGGSWSPVTGWNSHNTFTWAPTVANPNYRVSAWVRSNGSTRDEPDATTSEDFPITAAAPPATARLQAVTLAASAPAPQRLGTTITFTAVPSGGTSQQFKWFVHDGTQWNMVRDWSTSSTLSWRPTRPDPNYKIAVWVRNGGSTRDEAEVSQTMMFPIQ
jgi:hypothetical protein